MNRLLAADTFLIETTQEAYLWLWDRTGVYVATLIFSFAVCERLLWGPVGWFSIFLIGAMGVFSTTRYIAQQNDLRLLNQMASSWRARWFRAVFFALFSLSLALDFGSPSRLASDVLFSLWNYLACVQVRDRDPKDLFQTRKLAVQS